MRRQVAVCGPAEAGDGDLAFARDVGRLLAEAGAVVLCGGGGGVMAAAAEGASAAGGLVVGVVPDGRGASGSAHLDVVIRTAMGQARNAVLVESADVVIAVGGSWGTLSEIALAHRRGVPVVALSTWQLLDAAGTPLALGVEAETPAAAVAAALALAEGAPDV